MFCFHQPPSVAPRVPIKKPSAKSELAVIDRQIAELQRQIDKQHDLRAKQAKEMGEPTALNGLADHRDDVPKWTKEGGPTRNETILAEHDRMAASLKRERDALAKRRAAVAANR